MKEASEHKEQVATVEWFRLSFKDVAIIAIPNGGKRGKIEAARLKKEGVTAGVTDLYVPAWKLWVEMKKEKGGSFPKTQKDWRDYVLSIGDNWMICKGFDDARKQISEFACNIKKS